MIGETVSHYKIIDKIGGGGMGVVYKAHDSKLKRTVALKFLPPAFSSEPEAKERFIHEARTASALDHPNICNIFDIDETKDGQSFIAMAYYDGVSLKEKIKNGPLELDDAINITVQLINGLKRAHDKGIVHRDIKPANIMITDHGEVKILDFGLAKLAGQTKLTKTGTTMGTTSYMSPEQVRGEMVDQRSDIWSLGVVIYEMLSGQSPFPGEYEQAVMYSILNEDSAPLSDFRGDVPDVLDKVVSKTMSKNLEGRYQDMDALLTDLVALKDQPEIGEITTWPKRKRLSRKAKKSLLLYGGLALGGVLIILLFWYFFLLGVDQIDSIAVLPFENMSGNPDMEIYADGITMDLIGELSKISAFDIVIAWPSVAVFKEITKPTKDITRELNVKTIVYGTLSIQEDDISIRTNLIEGRSEKQLWYETYEDEIDETKNILKNISKSIAKKLNLKITDAEANRLRATKKINPDAYRAYLLGNHFFNSKKFEKGIEYYEQALKIDSTYTEAHLGIAGAYIAKLFHWTPYEEVIPIIRREVHKAMRLDSTLDDTKQVRAMLHLMKWEWKKAEKLFREVLRENPNHALAHSGYGICMMVTGRYEEGIKAKERHLELDPVSLLANTNLCAAYYNARRYDETIAQAKRVLEIDSTHFPAYYFLAHSFTMKGLHEKSISIVESQDFEKKNPAVASNIYAAAGMKEKALELIKEINTMNFAGEIATTHLLLDNKDRALEWLERAYEHHTMDMMGIKIEPYFEPLHDDPRYQDLLKRVGLFDE